MRQQTFAWPPPKEKTVTENRTVLKKKSLKCNATPPDRRNKPSAVSAKRSSCGSNANARPWLPVSRRCGATTDAATQTWAAFTQIHSERPPSMVARLELARGLR
jgi:hypothetical protein